MVAVTNATDMEAAQSEASGLFRQVRRLRPGQDDDFEVFASDSLVAILKENTDQSAFGDHCHWFDDPVGSSHWPDEYYAGKCYRTHPRNWYL